MEIELSPDGVNDNVRGVPGKSIDTPGFWSISWKMAWAALL